MSPLSPEDAGEFGRYCHYRFRGEDEECTRLRMNLGEDDARQHETDYQTARSQRQGAAA